MAITRISNLRVTRERDTAILSARVDSPDLGCAGERLWFRMPADVSPREPRAEAFVVALLLPAAVAGSDVVVESPLSPSLARNLSQLQQLLVGWNPVNPWTRFRHVDIRAARFDEPRPAGPAAGLFFSGGVDSMYALMRAEAETGRSPDTLVFVHGFDVPLERPGRAATVLRHVTGVAKRFGRRLVRVDTNLRRFTDPALHWDMAHGAGLAAIGHALGERFDRWFISASDAHFRNGELSGTTTAIDRLWSREGLAFVSVGGSVDRQAKVDLLAGESWAGRHLVVCWKAPDAIANCGRCSKCLRTMLNFLVANGLHAVETLPARIAPELLSHETMRPEPYRIVHWEAMMERLGSRPEWAPLLPPIAALIERSRRFKERPSLTDLTSHEGRTVALEWVRRTLRKRMPVSVRRRILPLYHHWRHRGCA